jgi:hypothetical protein
MANAGIWRPDVPGDFDVGAIPDGSQVMSIQTGYISQTVSEVLTPGNTYQLTAYIGEANLEPLNPNQYAVQLLAGGNLLAETTSPDPPHRQFTAATVTYAAPANSPFLGQNVEVRLVDLEPDVFLSDPQFDYVTLDRLGLPGDFNEDGEGNAADHVAWKKIPSLFGGDPAGYNIWVANFGEVLSGAGATAGVDSGEDLIPEPSSISLFVLFGFWSFASRHAIRSRPLTTRATYQNAWSCFLIKTAATTKTRRRMAANCFVLAGLFGILTSPSLAAPAVDVYQVGTFANGHLNAAGDWVWRVRIHQSVPPVDLPDPDGGGPQPDPPAGSPLAVELGFLATGSALISATANTTEFNDPNPGNPIWGWENYSDTNGDTVIDFTPPTDDEPIGLQSNCAGGGCSEYTPGDDPNTIFAALGSVDYHVDVDGKDFLTITTEGPSTTGSLQTTLQMLGTYGTGGNKGRIAELNPAFTGGVGSPPISINWDVYNSTFSRSAIAGDANLSGTLDSTDYDTWSQNVGVGTKHWFHADFNDDDIVDSVDLNILLDAAGRPGDFDFSGAVDAADYVMWRKGLNTVFTPGDYDIWRAHFGQPAGTGASESLASVPEPAAYLLLTIAVLTSYLGHIGSRLCR